MKPGASGLEMSPMTRPPTTAMTAARTCPASFCLGFSENLSSSRPVAKITQKAATSIQ